MKSILLIATIISISFLLLTPATNVQAAGLVPCGQLHNDPATSYNESDPCTVCHTFLLGEIVIDFVLFKLLPAAAGLLYIIAGLLFIFWGFSPKASSTAKSIFTNTSYGIAIIFLSWLFTNTLLRSLAGDSNVATTWYKIECKVNVNNNGPLPIGPGGGGKPPISGGTCKPNFGTPASAGCSNLASCVDVSSYTPTHGCQSNNGKCLLSSQAAANARKFISTFNNLSGGKCRLEIASAIQVNGGPSGSNCHKVGTSATGTCADFHLLPDYNSCKDYFYQAAKDSGAVRSFDDEYVCKATTTTGDNIHTNF